jgi:integrase
LGKAISPHLFRDCAVTCIALENPRHIRIASPLLGHRTLSTTEKYYNQARGVEASRIMQNYLLSLRRGEKRSQSTSRRQGQLIRMAKVR